MREHLFQLPDSPESSLQIRIREMLVSLILDGHLPAGSPLPSGRRLASQLNVARNTVTLAYQHLVDEGFIEARERSGYYVSSSPPGLRASSAPVAEEHPDCTRWDERFHIHPSRQKNIVKPANWQHYQYPFVYGQIDPALFPIADWRECSRDASTVSAIRAWASDRTDQDDPELVEQIHTRVLPRRGVWAQPEDILVTLGAQQALFILADLLLGPDTRVGMEEPGYSDVRNMLNLRSRQVTPLELDSEGIVVNDALRQCDCVYVTPSHQFPTTITMSAHRRLALLECAEDNNMLVIEDDYESELNFAGTPTPALKSQDPGGRVVYVGSLSKTLAPGLRLGFMVGPSDLIREARALRRLMTRHPPANNQLIVARFLKLGHHDSLVRRLSHTYRERWTIMSEALDEFFPDASLSPTFGGSAFWVRGPDGLNSVELWEKAQEKSILIEPGDVFFASPNPPKNYFRLGFASVPSDRIRPGVEKLADIVHRIV